MEGQWEDMARKTYLIILGLGLVKTKSLSDFLYGVSGRYRENSRFRNQLGLSSNPSATISKLFSLS